MFSTQTESQQKDNEVTNETPQKDIQVPTETSQKDITQQATTLTLTTHIKNPKLVAAGKMVAARTCLASAQQKKALSEASIILANNKAKASTPTLEPAPDRAPTTENSEKNSSPLSTTQWLMIGSIVVGLIGIYYKREELKAKAKAVFSEKMTEPALVEPDLSPAPQPKGLRLMD